MTNHKNRYTENWQAPTLEERLALFEKHNISAYRVGKLTGQSTSTITRWLETDSTAITPKYAPWRLLLIELGEI